MKRTKSRRKSDPAPVKLIAPMTVTMGDWSFTVQVVDRISRDGQPRGGLANYEEQVLYVSRTDGALPDMLERLATNLGMTLVNTWNRIQESKHETP